MNGATYERAWRWIAWVVPCGGAVALAAFGWESLPPWHRPADRVWRLQPGGAPLDRFAAREATAPRSARSTSELDANPGDLDSSSGDDETAIRSLAAPGHEISESTPVVDAPPKRYWLNARSGVRHNADCRYFDPAGTGRYCASDEGRPCRVCGG